MLPRVRFAAVLGIDAYLADVETDIANGGSTFWARASTLLSGYSMPTFLMSALKRGSGRRGSKKGAGVMITSHSARSS